MALIADLIADVLYGRRRPESVREDVVSLRKSFPQLQYCFA